MASRGNDVVDVSAWTTIAMAAPHVTICCTAYSDDVGAKLGQSFVQGPRCFIEVTHQYEGCLSELVAEMGQFNLELLQSFLSVRAAAARNVYRAKNGRLCQRLPAHPCKDEVWRP
jgi:hypothetical protein